MEVLMSSKIEREVRRNTADWSKAGGDRVTVQRDFPVGTPAAKVQTGFGWPGGDPDGPASASLGGQRRG